MMRLVLSCVGFAVVAGAAMAGSTVLPTDFPTDGRIRVLEYHENDIYRITSLYGYQTNVEFDEGEEIQTISVGDRSLWQLIPSGKRLFIRPMDENVSTNMTVITNLRAYQFDLRAGKGDPKDNPEMVYVARFIYPPKATPQAARFAPEVAVTVPAPVLSLPHAAVKASPPPAPVPAPPLPAAKPALPASAPPLVIPPPPIPPVVPYAAPEPVVPVPAAKPASAAASAPEAGRNYLYTYTGKDELAPLDVYDDGTSTFLRFPDAAKISAIAAVDPAGKKTALTPLVQGEMLVVPGVAERFELRYAGGDVVTLFNEARAASAGAGGAK